MFFSFDHGLNNTRSKSSATPSRVTRPVSGRLLVATGSRPELRINYNWHQSTAIVVLISKIQTFMNTASRNPLERVKEFENQLCYKRNETIEIVVHSLFNIVKH